MPDKCPCLNRIREAVDRLAKLKADYAMQPEKQEKILLHFIDRAEQIAKASLLIDPLATPLMILCRVLCEDFLLACWISQSVTAAEEYEAGVTSELVKMMAASLNNGWGVIRNRRTGQTATKDFMQDQFFPKLKALKAQRTNLDQIAQRLGLGKLYDILYRGASLEVHANNFGITESSDEGADYAALSSIEVILACLLDVLELPRKPFAPEPILVKLKLMRAK